MTYKVSVFVDGFPGFFRYSVDTREQAMAHFAAITTGGYRRLNDRGQLEWYAPSMLKIIKVEGNGLETHYPDDFIRT